MPSPPGQLLIFSFILTALMMIGLQLNSQAQMGDLDVWPLNWAQKLHILIVLLTVNKTHYLTVSAVSAYYPLSALLLYYPLTAVYALTNRPIHTIRISAVPSIVYTLSRTSMLYTLCPYI